MAITDKDSALAWLEAQSDQRICIAFAARAALRSAPNLGISNSRVLEPATLPFLRATLTAGVAGAWQTSRIPEKLSTAAERAAHLADVTSDSIGQLPFFSLASAHAAAQTAALSANYNTAAARSAAHCARAFFTNADDANSALSASAAAANAADTSAVFAAAYSAADWDAVHLDPEGKETTDKRSVFTRPLWPSEPRRSIPPGEPVGLADGYAKITAFFDSDPKTWGFWKRWLEGMRNGQPMDWALQEQVALIPDEVWDAGPEAVAAAISKIEAELEDEFEPLDQDGLQRHAEGLLRQPDLTADAAESIALQVEGSIADFKREAPANNLPDGFEKLEKLPVVFRGISTTIRVSGETEDRTAKLVAEINRLHVVIEGLERDLAKAHRDLSDARLTKLEAAQQRTCGEKTQTWLTNITLIGSLGLNMAWFMGLDREDLRYSALKTQIEQRIEQMKAAEPSEDEADLPPIREL